MIQIQVYLLIFVMLRISQNAFILVVAVAGEEEIYRQPEQSRGHKRKLRANPEQLSSDCGLGWSDEIATVGRHHFVACRRRMKFFHNRGQLTNSDFQNLF
jgi:hypothetical protein